MRTTLAALVVVLGLAAAAVGGVHLWRARRAGLQAPAATRPAAPAATNPTAAPPLVPDDPKALLAKALAIYDQVDAKQYDIDRVAQSASSGIQPAFAFVRDRIRYEAYPGVLRGADGALAARAANSYDRSLLLARLLSAQGITTRFAIGTLGHDRAEQLFSHMFDKPRSDGGSGPRGDHPAADAFWQRVAARGNRDYRAIAASVHFGAAPSGHDALVNVIAKHVWLQAHVNDNWLDLDTAFADAAPGKAYCDAETTTDSVPEDWNQTVTARVVVERLAGGELSRTSVLELKRPAVDLVDREIFLAHAPDRDSGPGGLLQVGGGSSEWRPTLWIDGESVQGDPVNFSDETAPGGAFDALAGGGGGSTSVFVAEWLEFELDAPDGSHAATRRVLVDRAGEAWRQQSTHDASALRPLAMIGATPAAAEAVHNIWMTAGPHNLARITRKALMLMLPVPADEPQPDANEQALDFTALQNLSTLLWSDHVIVPSLDDAPNVHMYVGSPRITIVSQVPAGPAGDRLTETYDLRRDVLVGAARDAAGESAIRDRKVRFGAMEGALEHEATVRDLEPAGAAVRIVSTSSLLTPSGIVSITPEEATRLATMTPDGEKRARIAESLRDGNVLLAPRDSLASGPAAWWEVAPDGATRAVLGADLNAVVGSAPLPWNSGFGTSPLPRIPPRVWNLPPNTPTPRPGETLDQLWRRVEREMAAAEKRNKNDRGGNEYITVVTAVGVGTLVAVTAYAAIKEYHFQMAMRQVESVSAAADAGR